MNKWNKHTEHQDDYPTQHLVDHHHDLKPEAASHRLFTKKQNFNKIRRTDTKFLTIVIMTHRIFEKIIYSVTNKHNPEGLKTQDFGVILIL